VPGAVLGAGVRLDPGAGEQPVLRTDRLRLRPFTLADAADVRRLAGDPRVSATALDLPHPFEDGMAEAWIGTHPQRFAAGTLAAFAVTSREGTELYGAVGLMIEPAHRRAELGYWLGTPYWGRGYATEAAGAVIRYGFDRLGLQRIHANHLVRNPGSGRVLQKLGMRYEGCLRRHAWHRNSFEDLALYGVLRSEFAQGDPGVGDG